MSAFEDGYETKGPSEHGTETGYTVEARHAVHPVQLGKQIFDAQWRRVRFQPTEKAIGVPHWGVPGPRHAHKWGLMGYPAAQALRWWVQANAEAEIPGGGLCLETRIVKHKVTFEVRVEAVSWHSRTGGDDRSNIFPDWGRRKEGSTEERQ